MATTTPLHFMCEVTQTIKTTPSVFVIIKSFRGKCGLTSFNSDYSEVTNTHAHTHTHTTVSNTLPVVLVVWAARPNDSQPTLFPSLLTHNPHPAFPSVNLWIKNTTHVHSYKHIHVSKIFFFYSLSLISTCKSHRKKNESTRTNSLQLN